MTVFFSEFFIDWIKHAFVMKFNNISAKVIKFLFFLLFIIFPIFSKHSIKVFEDFKITLAQDYFESKKKRVNINTIDSSFEFFKIDI